MKTAFIAGAGQRLGKTIAKTLHQAGYKVILHYYKSEKQTKLLAKKLGCQTVQANLTNLDEVKKMFASLPHIDILINTVGGFIFKPLSETKPEELVEVIHNNLVTAWYCDITVLPSMRKKKFGRVIHFGSVGCDQITARPNTTPYYMAKTSLLMLTKSLANEHQNTGVTINMISPGVLPTGVKPSSKIPVIPFDDIARGVLFLVSNESKNINGTNLEISGGWRPE